MAVATRIAVRDPLGDHPITPQNSAMVVIDYQPSQIAAVRSMDKDLLLKNTVSTTKLPKLFGIPIMHSTSTSRPDAAGRRFSSSPSFSRITRRSTERRSILGRTQTSFALFAPRGGAS